MTCEGRGGVNYYIEIEVNFILEYLVTVIQISVVCVEHLFALL